jgi:hypothetical protein
MSEYIDPRRGTGGQRRSGPGGNHTKGTTDPNQTSVFDLETARNRRDRGMRAAELNTWRPWRDRAEAGIIQLADSGREFSADDLVALVGPPVSSSQNAIGPVFAWAAREGLIECVGFRQSERSSRRGGITRVWRGVVV